MLKLKLPFGFKTIQYDNLYVLYTGKIRIKTSYDLVCNRLSELSVCVTCNNKGYTTISYVTTDRSIHEHFISVINSMLEEIMIDRVKLKYSGSRVTTVESTELCW